MPDDDETWLGDKNSFNYIYTNHSIWMCADTRFEAVSKFVPQSHWVKQTEAPSLHVRLGFDFQEYREQSQERLHEV